MEQVAAARSAMKAVQASEVALAAAMGVPLVATSMAHSRDARYSAFLHRALVYARARPTPEGRGVDDSCPVSTLTLDIMTHREQLRFQQKAIPKIIFLMRHVIQGKVII
jgi:hypothetical protein